jgi:hypothetical protein
MFLHLGFVYLYPEQVLAEHNSRLGVPHLKFWACTGPPPHGLRRVINEGAGEGVAQLGSCCCLFQQSGVGAGHQPQTSGHARKQPGSVMTGVRGYPPRQARRSDDTFVT